LTLPTAKAGGFPLPPGLLPTVGSSHRLRLPDRNPSYFRNVHPGVRHGDALRNTEVSPSRLRRFAAYTRCHRCAPRTRRLGSPERFRAFVVCSLSAPAGFTPTRTSTSIAAPVLRVSPEAPRR
jgi:hypothetical protein